MKSEELFEKLNKIEKLPGEIIKNKREKTKITGVRNEGADITTDPIVI